MFLTIAYTTFLVQTSTIIFLLLPVPLKLKKLITNIFEKVLSNKYAKFVLVPLIAMTLGLYVESIYNSLRYESIRYETIDSITANAGKNELLVKLFRSQRNMYLTFIVNFYWLILFGIYRFINNIIDLEYENSRLKISLTNTNVNNIFNNNNNADNNTDNNDDKSQ
jgi:hypothetical protein